MGLLDRKREVAIRQESTPGTAIALTSSHVLVRPRKATRPRLAPRSFDPDEAHAYPDMRPLRMGIQECSMEMGYQLRAPGDLTSAPAVSPIFESALWQRFQIWKVTIGTITSGPFQNMESFAAAPSGATGVVWMDTADGTTTLYYYELTGTVADGDTITGDTSGASATVSGAPSENGNLFRQSDSGFEAGEALHHVTAAWFNDGAMVRMRGALSEMAVELKNAEPAIVTHQFLGVFDDDTDTDLFGVETYPEESVNAPLWQGIGFFLDSYQPVDTTSMRLRFPVGLALREDAQEADGVKFCGYDRGAPQIDFSPGFVKKAVHPYLQNFRQGTTVYLKFLWGTAAGAIWEFHAPAVQFTQADPDDRAPGLAVLSNTVRCTGSKNDSAFLWQR